MTLYRLNINTKLKKLITILIKISHFFLKIFFFKTNIEKMIKKLFIIFSITLIRRLTLYLINFLLIYSFFSEINDIKINLNETLLI